MMHFKKYLQSVRYRQLAHWRAVVSPSSARYWHLCRSVHILLWIAGTISMTGCSEAPQCIPGRTVACPCLPAGQGVQRCAEDGSRYLECQCGHLPSPIQSLSEASPLSQPFDAKLTTKSPKNKASANSSTLLNQAIPSSFATKTSDIDQTDPKARAEGVKAINKMTKPLKVIPLEAEIKEVSQNEKKSTAESVSATKTFKLNLRNQQKVWWFYSDTLERCVKAKNVNGIDYAPLKLLSEGCYRLGGSELMVIRCDDPPLGPKVYRFAERESECIKAKSEARVKEQKKRAKEIRERAQPKINISPLDPVIEAKREEPKKRAISSGDSSDQRSWHCMCYEEVFRGSPKLSTACRPSREMCLDLAKKVKEGSKILVKDSLAAPCQERRGSSPWRIFKGKGARRYFWQPSSHPGAWWSAEGCFLPLSKKKRAALRAKRAKRQREQSSAPSSSKVKAKSRKESSPPPELLEPIGERRSLIRYGEQGSAPRADRCRETCRANLISPNERKAEYGVRSVPPLLRWGKPFADRVKLVKTICMSNQKRAKRGRDRCLKKVISKCSIYCERAEE